MIRHLVLVVLACVGCLNEATLASQPDANQEPPPMDGSGSGSDTGTPLPQGVSMLASGNYLGLAAHGANNKIYGVEYSGQAIVIHPTRIVSIDTTSGLVETFYDLGADTRPPTNLQATDTALFWLRQTDSGVALFRKTFAGASTADPVVVSGLSNLPAAYTLDMYALHPGDNKIYLMLTKGASYTLGSIPIGGIATTATPFTSLVSGTIPNATSISFVDVTNTIAHLGTIVYAGGHASGSTNTGFVLKFDTSAKTVVTVSSLANTFMHAFWATGARTQWIAETAGVPTMFTGDPLNMANTGAVASLPNGAYGLIAQGPHFYATGLPGTGTDLVMVTPGTMPAVPPTGTTTMVASIAECVGQTSQDCVPKISLLAADLAAVYWSTTNGVYKYTP